MKTTTFHLILFLFLSNASALISQEIFLFNYIQDSSIIFLKEEQNTLVNLQNIIGFEDYSIVEANPINEVGPSPSIPPAFSTCLIHFSDIWFRTKLRCQK